MSATRVDRGNTRVDSFVDAAFAFALTLLILTADASAPQSMAEFTQALKRIPAFAMGFTLIAMFWHAHVLWSRHYGPRDAISTLISLVLVFTVLVFVYPLRTMASSFMYFLSGGALPAEFSIASIGEFRVFVLTYGSSYFTMSLLIAALYAHSVRRRLEAALDDTQWRAARIHRNIWLIQAGAALLSLILVWLGEMATTLSMWSYALLAIVLPIYGALSGAREKRRAAAGSEVHSEMPGAAQAAPKNPQSANRVTAAG